MNTQVVAPVIHVGITDHFAPDVQAMLLAMYSRSYASILTRLPATPEEEQSLRSRLQKFYVNYGHKSVGQLGTTTIWLEGVSQLAAKAIEDHPLYNGQESSTRYIDFSNQPFVSPKMKWELDDMIPAIQEEFRQIYIDALPLVSERLVREYPLNIPPETPGDKVDALMTTWSNTIKARAFDICRGLLPAGCTTNVAFQGTFDTINDHFGAMLHHPAQEMRDIAERVLVGLKDFYPDATPGVEVLRERFAYMKGSGLFFYPPMMKRAILENRQSLDERYVENWVGQRKKHELLPRIANINSRWSIGGLIDFGAFRDLHRHRNGVCLMPTLTAEHGMHPWYTKELPESINERVAKAIRSIEQTNSDYCSGTNYTTRVNLQYAIPMGCRVPVEYECDFGQLAYLIELRTGKTVHQTLRHYMHDVYKRLQEIKPRFGEAVYPDLDEDNFTLKRGTQTFSGEFK